MKLKSSFETVRLGVYGDVHRVKILFNKKDSALIQFATPQQATVGMCSRSRNEFFMILLIYFLFSLSKS